MTVPSDNGKDVTSEFLKSTLTPLAAETYIRSKDSEFGGRHNPSRNVDYDMLAVAAHEHGLLANQTIPRAKGVSQSDEVQEHNRSPATMPK